MLSIGQAASLIGVHVDTLKRWEKDGHLIPGRTPTNRRRYRRADVLAAIKRAA
jgi:putative resolvase